MDLDIRQSGNICFLSVKGALKYGEPCTKLETAVADALNSGHIQLVLDLSAMPVIDSCGIGTLVNALRQSRKFGGDTRLVNPSSFAEKTFRMTGIHTLFQIHATEAEALEAVTH